MFKNHSATNSTFQEVPRTKSCLSDGSPSANYGEQPHKTLRLTKKETTKTSQTPVNQKELGSSTPWTTQSHVLAYAVPCILAVLLYLNGLPGDFVHDDVLAIERNEDVSGQTPLTQLFGHDFWGRPMDDHRSHKSYRPLTVLSFRFDHYFSEGDPRWFHTVNIFLHACATALVVLISISVLNATPFVAMIAAGHFAVHPIHTEAVTGIVGRADILAAVFFLTSFYFYFRCIREQLSPESKSSPPHLRRSSNHQLSQSTPPSTSMFSKDMPPWQSSKQESTEDSRLLPIMSTSHSLNLMVSLFLSGAAMLSKETGVAVLGVVLCYDILFHLDSVLRMLRHRKLETKLWPFIFRVSCLIIWGILLVSFRGWIMNFEQPEFRPEDNLAAQHRSMTTRFLTFAYLPSFNFWLMLCPVKLSYDWAVGSIPLVHSLADPRNFLAGAFYIGLLGLGWHCVRQQLLQVSQVSKPASPEEEDETPPANPNFVCLMAIILMIIPFVPASNILFYVGFVVAERILYIPSIGFSLLVGQGIVSLTRRLPFRKLVLVVLCASFGLTLGLRTIRRNQDWLSRESLFRSGLRSLPDNAKMHYNLANLLRDTGDPQTAEYHYKQAIRLYPYHPSYHLNLGTILTNRSEAELCYKKALELYPDHTGAMVNLASNWIEDGKHSEAMPLLNKALEVDPSYAEAFLTMAKALLDQKEMAKADLMFKRTLELRPDWSKAHFYYAVFLKNSNDLDSALREFLHVELDPLESIAKSNAARICISRNEFAQAQTLLHRALQLEPSCSECLSVLASSFSKQGQMDQAVVTLGQATHLAPNDTNIALRYVDILKQAGHAERAKAALNNLLLKVPFDLYVLHYAFSYAMEENRLNDAAEYNRVALQEAERNSHNSLSALYHEQGDVFRLQEDYDRALESYKRAIQLDGQHVSSIVSSGSILYIKKQFTQAQTFYLRALELQPNHQIARENLQRLRRAMASGG